MMNEDPAKECGVATAPTTIATNNVTTRTDEPEFIVEGTITGSEEEEEQEIIVEGLLGDSSAPSKKSSASISSIKKKYKVKKISGNCYSPSSATLQQEKRFLAYPKYKQKAVMIDEAGHEQTTIAAPPSARDDAFSEELVVPSSTTCMEEEEEEEVEGGGVPPEDDPQTQTATGIQGAAHLRHSTGSSPALHSKMTTAHKRGLAARRSTRHDLSGSPNNLSSGASMAARGSNPNDTPSNKSNNENLQPTRVRGLAGKKPPKQQATRQSSPDSNNNNETQQQPVVQLRGLGKNDAMVGLSRPLETTTTTTTMQSNTSSSNNNNTARDPTNPPGTPETRKKKEGTMTNLVRETNTSVVPSFVQKRISTDYAGTSSKSAVTMLPGGTSSRSTIMIGRVDSLARPGAYADVGDGTTTNRVNSRRFFSLLGGDRGPGGGHGGMVEPTTMMPPPTLPVPSDHYNSSDLLSKAFPVEEEYRASKRLEAQPIDEENLDQSAARDAKYRRWKRFGCGFVAVSCIALVVSLSIGLTTKKSESTVGLATDIPTPSPTSSGTSRPLPPMENLEVLYAELSEKTKESLYNRDSPQYQAWAWLLNHPNITSYPEWRKKQIFAMSTFFLALEGRSWPEETSNRDRWMDVTISECSWIANTFDNTIFYQATAKRIGRDAYKEQDWKACTENGEIQTLSVNHLYLPDNLNPYIPPEIAMLSSLRILAFFQGSISARLSDFLVVPDLIQLPNLQCLIFRDLGLSGSIPTSLGLFTGLRHLSILHNQITGSIPSEIGGMTALEYFNVADDRSLTGELPTEVGLLTRLKGLEIYRSSLSGTIPTQLGWLNRLTTIFLDGNKLMSGTLPSELGLLTVNTWLALYSNRLTGSLPTELGLMTSTKRLRIWNNALTGSIPSELGSMTNVVHFRVGNDLALDGPRNDFDGSLPPKLWEFSHMEELFLPNLPNLNGSIPREMLMPNLTLLSLSGSPFISGTIPESICLVEELDFDCSDLLCGCDCECGATGMVNNGETSAAMNESSNPIHDEQAWPGLFPTPVNRSNAITINILTDRHPGETKYEWSLRNAEGLWGILDSEDLREQEKVYSYTKDVESNSVYRLELFDSEGDGTCCRNGLGWFTITNSTPSPDHTEGTVLWKATGSLLENSLHVYIWVDKKGHAKVLEHLTGHVTNKYTDMKSMGVNGRGTS